MLDFHLVRTGVGEAAGCRRCGATASPRAADPDHVLEELRAAMARVNGSQTAGVMFAGGEPLAREGFVDLVRAARSLGALRIAALSGGQPIGDVGRAEPLVREGLRHLHVALAEQDATGQDAVAAMRAFKSAGAGLGVRTMLVGRVPVCSHNLESLPGLVALCAESGADALVLSVTATLEPRRAIPWLSAAFDTGLANGLWVSVEGMDSGQLGTAAAAARPVMRIVGDTP